MDAVGVSDIFPLFIPSRLMITHFEESIAGSSESFQFKSISKGAKSRVGQHGNIQIGSSNSSLTIARISALLLPCPIFITLLNFRPRTG